MKKVFIIILVAIMTLLLGCTSEPSRPVTDPTDSNENDINISVEDEAGKGFVAKANKYQYEEKDLVIFTLENQTAKNYTVIITMKFYDSTGQVIKKQTQKLDGFAAGYQKHFLFRPNINFEEFSYTVDTKEYTGTCYEQDLTISFTELREFWSYPLEVESLDEIVKIPSIILCADYSYQGTLPIYYTPTYIVFDNEGKIYTIASLGRNPVREPFEMKNNGVAIIYQQKNGNELIWPENLNGNVTAIFIVNTQKIQ